MTCPVAGCCGGRLRAPRTWWNASGDQAQLTANLISNNHFGIWLSKPVTAYGLRTNVFANVNTPISAGH